MSNAETINWSIVNRAILEADDETADELTLLQNRHDLLLNFVTEIMKLASESDGIAGYHQNGDLLS